VARRVRQSLAFQLEDKAIIGPDFDVLILDVPFGSHQRECDNIAWCAVFALDRKHCGGPMSYFPFAFSSTRTRFINMFGMLARDLMAGADLFNFAAMG
jgi:hypothetical protein